MSSQKPRVIAFSCTIYKTRPGFYFLFFLQQRSVIYLCNTKKYLTSLGGICNSNFRDEIFYKRKKLCKPKTLAFHGESQRDAYHTNNVMKMAEYVHYEDVLIEALYSAQ